jgi:hypothetical protein
VANDQQRIVMNARISRTALGGGLFAAVLLIAGCSGGSAGGATDSQSPSGNTQNQGNAPNGFRPAASGVIAAISGRTLQVQNATEQTAVTYSASTKFTAERSTNLNAVQVGSCIVATAKSASNGSTQARRLTADAVRIEPARNGHCGGGPGLTRPGGAPPSSFPTGLPSGAIVQGPPQSGGPTGGRTTIGSAIAGKVTGIDGTTITVATTTPGPSSSSSATQTTGTVHVTDATGYTTTAAATHRALKIGLCAVVSGTADSTGAVAATRIALSRKTNGSCDFVIGGGPNG